MIKEDVHIILISKIRFRLNSNVVVRIILAINAMRNIQIIKSSHGIKRILMKRQYFVVSAKRN